MSNLNMILVLTMVFITLNLYAQDTKRIPAIQNVEKTTTIKNLPQRKNVVELKSVPVQSGDKGLKKSGNSANQSIQSTEIKKEFTTEEKAMIQYKASLKSEGFYNSRDNIEKRKKAILLNYLGVDSVDDPSYPEKKRLLAAQFPEKYAAFKREMNTITISKQTK